MHPHDGTSTPPPQESTVVIEDESWKHGFTKVPNIILRTSDLSLGAKMTYAVLLSYAWDSQSCFPGQKRMAEDMGCSVRSVITYLKELEKTGIVVIKRRGLGRPNLYILPRLKEDARRLVVVPRDG